MYTKKQLLDEVKKRLKTESKKQEHFRQMYGLQERLKIYVSHHKYIKYITLCTGVADR